VLKLDKNIYPIQVKKRAILNTMAVIALTIYLFSSFYIVSKMFDSWALSEPLLLDAFLAAQNLLVRVLIVIVIIASAVAFYDFLYKGSIEYYLDKENFVLKGGVISRFEKVLPYSRIQHVIIRESFLQRILGLASVSIQTAREIETSTSYWWRSAPTVPDLNLEDAKKLRDQIICISNKAYRPIAGV
jgi:uncharacterized membrane protein YdbT with pleckstrin-like domain